MDSLTAILRGALVGDFGRESLKGYLGVQAAVFWTLILLAWWAYPANHHFSILTHTFSFLGSPNPEHNPRFWWLFSLAMVFWGSSAMPVVLHLHRGFASLAPWLGTAGTACLGLGCVGLVLIGVFPDARHEWHAGLTYSQVHTRIALLTAAAFGSGLTLYGLAALKSALLASGAGAPAGFPHRRAAWPLLFWLVTTGTSVFMVLRWAQIYRRLEAAAIAEGRAIGSSWTEGLKTLYSFPLWENIAIYALYITLIWLALAVGHSKPPPH
ncbi:MAG TPA: hypothetical protein PKM73_16485 [Verrucomicrobiota bacterium]|nr:hypothetical protein [Verrucomicrobiota bacterium]HNU51591.1 hypothetical protein [Verrucomicrobiota bacterium]